MIVIIP